MFDVCESRVALLSDMESTLGDVRRIRSNILDELVDSVSSDSLDVIRSSVLGGLDSSLGVIEFMRSVVSGDSNMRSILESSTRFSDFFEFVESDSFIEVSESDSSACVVGSDVVSGFVSSDVGSDVDLSEFIKFVESVGLSGFVFDRAWDLNIEFHLYRCLRQLFSSEFISVSSELRFLRLFVSDVESKIVRLRRDLEFARVCRLFCSSGVTIGGGLSMFVDSIGLLEIELSRCVLVLGRVRSIISVLESKLSVLDQILRLCVSSVDLRLGRVRSISHLVSCSSDFLVGSCSVDSDRVRVLHSDLCYVRNRASVLCTKLYRLMSLVY